MIVDGSRVRHTLILKARLNPDAKKPPNGATMEAKVAMTRECSCMADTGQVSSQTGMLSVGTDSCGGRQTTKATQKVSSEGDEVV